MALIIDNTPEGRARLETIRWMETQMNAVLKQYFAKNPPVKMLSIFVRIPDKDGMPLQFTIEGTPAEVRIINPPEDKAITLQDAELVEEPKSMAESHVVQGEEENG